MRLSKQQLALLGYIPPERLNEVFDLKNIEPFDLIKDSINQGRFTDSLGNEVKVWVLRWPKEFIKNIEKVPQQFITNNCDFYDLGYSVNGLIKKPDKGTNKTDFKNYIKILKTVSNFFNDFVERVDSVASNQCNVFTIGSEADGNFSKGTSDARKDKVYSEVLKNNIPANYSTSKGHYKGKEVTFISKNKIQ